MGEHGGITVHVKTRKCNVSEEGEYLLQKAVATSIEEIQANRKWLLGDESPITVKRKNRLE